MERIINLLQTLDRPGRDQVIDYLRTSNYATARCHTHHTYRGGLVDHALEVYELMREQRGDLSEESLIVCALFHDLGKAAKRGWYLRGGHPSRSIQILDRCGFRLTAEERRSIGEHHPKARRSIGEHHSKERTSFVCPLRRCLSTADMISTGRWRVAHPRPDESPCKRLKNRLLLHLVELSRLV